MKLFIFGSTGDLVKKKVFPALEHFQDLEVISLGRKNLDNLEFNNNYCKDCSDKLKNRLNYKKIDFEKDFCKECLNLMNKEEENYFYLSLPPNLIYEILNETATLKEKGYKIQILIEKPFGNSLNQAKAIENLIKNKMLQNEIYLADHYLFKEGILKLNFNEKIENINIISLENEGINNRVYYDEVGAIKDMVQSHLLNILFKILKIKDEKIELNIQNLQRGQYKEYEQEIGKKSNTETYIKIKVVIIKEGKDKTEIGLETGKKLDKKEIKVKINQKEFLIQDKINPYINLFKDFFENKQENFPSINQSIKNWEITEQVLDYIKKNKITLDKY